MIRRWSVSLLLVHSCLALLLMGSEEFYDWHQYEYWQSEEDNLRKPISPVLGKDIQEAMSVDRWPDVRERTFHALNIPMSILLGWYSHPVSIYTNSVLGPLLLRVSQHTSVKSRVAILDAVLLLGICLQWWLVGLWLERPRPLARVLRVDAASMTLLGIVMTLMAVPKPLAENRVIVGTLELSSMVVALGWVLLIVAGTLSVVLAVARIVLQKKREEAFR
jgi:hypothetical protein